MGTLDRFAHDLGLPPERIRSLGWEEDGSQIHIPYHEPDGSVSLHRLDPASPSALPDKPYRLPGERPDADLVVTDKLTTALILRAVAGFAAVAVSGLGQEDQLTKEELERYQRIAVLIPEGKGQRLVLALRRRFDALGLLDRASWRVVKDRSIRSMWKGDRDAFLRGLNALRSLPLKDVRPLGTLAADVVIERVDWLAEGFFPLGKVTIVDGDPGLGKSVVLEADLAACVTTGRPFAGLHPVREGHVVIGNVEDGVADTLVPRLKAAGADLSRVTFIPHEVTVEKVDRQGKKAPATVPFILPEQIVHLRRMIDETGALLVVLDPFVSFLSPELSAIRDQDVRVFMNALARLAEEKGAAVVLVRHLNKAEGRSAMYRGGGSIGVIGSARSGLLVAKHPQDEDRRILASTKSNLGPPPPPLAFRLQTHPELDVPVVAWEGEVDLTADELVGADQQRRSSALERATRFLVEALGGGPRPSLETEAAAMAVGISERTLGRARKALGIVPTRDSDGRWWMSLKTDAEIATPTSNNGTETLPPHG